MDEAAVRRALDELAIQQLLARFAQLSDEDNLDEYLSYLTDDAVWEGPPGPGAAFGHQVRRGHADIVAGVMERRANGVQGPGTNSHHVITNTVVHVNGDAASAKSYYIYFQGADTLPVVRTMGVYVDALRRTPEGWKLAHRVLMPG